MKRKITDLSASYPTYLNFMCAACINKYFDSFLSKYQFGFKK